MMAPPARIHQKVSGALFNKLYNFLEGKPCEAYYAPFGVRLFPKADNSDDTFFEPDIVVVCDASKLDERGCNGAPDLVVEILSPSTMKNDLLYKLNKYRVNCTPLFPFQGRCGVRLRRTPCSLRCAPTAGIFPFPGALRGRRATGLLAPASGVGRDLLRRPRRGRKRSLARLQGV
jgi:hypothetical protein